MASTVGNVDVIEYVMLLIYCHWLSLIDRDCPAGSVRSTLVVYIYGYGRVSICMAVGSVPFDYVSLILYLIDI